MPVEPEVPGTEDSADSAWADRDVPAGRSLPGLLARAVRLVARAGPVGITVNTVLQLVGALSAAATVFMAKYLIEDAVAISQGQSTAGDAAGTVALFAAISAVTSANAALLAQQQRLLGDQVASALWRRLTAATCHVPLRDFEDPAFHNHLNRVVGNALSRPMVVATSLGGLIGGVAGVVAISVVLVSLEPSLVPVLVAAGLPALVAARFVSRSEFGFAAGTTQVSQRRTYMRSLLISRVAAKEVRAFGAADPLRELHDVEDVTFLSALRRQVIRRQVYGVLVALAAGAVLGTAILLTLVLVGQGEVTLAEAGAAIIAARLLASRVSGLFGSIAGLFEARPFLLDLEIFLDQSASSARPVDPAVPPAPHRERIELVDVTFSYPGCRGPAVRGVNLRLHPGEVVALVGENGSGKTTLAKLVGGLYSPEAGRITWDGHDVADLPAGAVPRATAVIFQDFQKYFLSASRNIGLGEPARLDDLAANQAAAERSGAHGFLRTLPNGYDTVLTNEFLGGTELSLGQWQRVALARALRRDAALVILDEPSSALDARVEAELFADMRTLLRGRSVLYISHRFSTVRDADRIVVMHEGRIVEEGGHDALLAAGGRYAELFGLQAAAFR